ncbi:MAG: tryptophan--tRNA ligase [Clostridiales bacterium]|jgi:tryptophanyl-tRNA synthetase|nr:tryptophan--tRNA ligase [Clostridiales bacterium]
MLLAEKTAEKKIIFSGMQPTGIPSLGNYLGALKNWVSLQDEYRCIYCVVDMHALTIRQDPAALRAKARELLALCLAMGIDPEKSLLYFQSHVPGHAELAWILNCFTYMGELNRMTQYKDKSLKHADNVNAGLFTYPVLMAADILLYGADLVPIGDDQRQHLELCRDIAIRFNHMYGDVFPVPEAYYGKVGARIMSLQEPEKKMSKSESENPNNVVYLLDRPDTVLSKFKKAVTDSGSEVRFDPDKPGISNLLTIYAAVTGADAAQAEREFAGSGYSDFKRRVGEAVVESLRPIQTRFDALIRDKEALDGLIKTHAERANALAGRMLRKVKKKIGYPI